jgi:hypothetical protein
MDLSSRWVYVTIGLLSLFNGLVDGSTMMWTTALPAMATTAAAGVAETTAMDMTTGTTSVPSFNSLTCYRCDSATTAGCSVGGEWLGGGAEVPTQTCNGRCVVVGLYTYSGSGYLLHHVERQCSDDTTNWLNECKDLNSNTAYKACYTICSTNYCNQDAPMKPQSQQSVALLAWIKKLSPPS